MTMTIETIGPEEAKIYLDYNKGNRPPKTSRIRVYANDMKSGKWILSPQGIAFDTDGILIDGQNRLFAVIKSGASVEMAVFRDVAPEARAVLDDGVKRNTSDVLSFQGEQNTSTISAICLRVMAYNNGKIAMTSNTHDTGGSGLDSNSFSRSQQIEFFQKHKDAILGLVDFGRHVYSQQPIRIASTSEIGLILYALGSSTDAREFINSVCLGINISQNTPEYALRQKLIRSTMGEARLNGADKLTLWKRAFEKRGTVVKILKL